MPLGKWCWDVYAFKGKDPRELETQRSVVSLQSLPRKISCSGRVRGDAIHGPRHTKDLDVWVDPVRENAEQVFKALAEQLPLD